MSFILEPSCPSRHDSVCKLPRGHVKVECRIGTLGLSPNIAAGILNISQTGAGLLLKAPVEVGAIVEVVLVASAQPRPVRVQAEVLQTQTAPDGACAAGVRFTKALDYHTWQLLT
jgi:hypothetical protein